MEQENESGIEEAAKSYRIGTLLYFRSREGRILLIRRCRKPNVGLWCAVGGKLEMESGESPFECAIREAREELGVDLGEKDLGLRCMLAEENYEGTGHWLMFVFECGKPLESLPRDIDEGMFGFFAREELSRLEMPEMDRTILLEKILNPNAPLFHVIKAAEGAEAAPEMLKVEQTVG